MLHEKRALGIFALSILIIAVFCSPTYAAGASKSAEPTGPIYVDFKHIVVPVIKSNGRTGVVSLSLMAEVATTEDQNIVTSHMPKYKDAFIRALYGTLENERYMKKNGSLDIDNIKARLMRSASLVAKGENNPIKDILFQQIGQQTY